MNKLNMKVTYCRQIARNGNVALMDHLKSYHNLVWSLSKFCCCVIAYRWANVVSSKNLVATVPRPTCVNYAGMFNRTACILRVIH